MVKKILVKRGNPIFFISHSSQDKEAVALFVNEILKLGLEFKRNEIFATSIEGHKIASGDDFIEAIREGIKKCKVVFLFLSENYKSSEICLNEMGAAWVLENCHVIPIIYGDLDYDNVGGLQISKQIERLNSESSLDNLVETLKGLGVVKEVNSVSWTVVKKKFLKDLKLIKFTSPPYKKLTKEEYQKMDDRVLQGEDAIEKLMEEKQELQKLVDELTSEPNMDKKKELLRNFDGDNAYEKEFETAISGVNDCFSDFSTIVSEIILCNYHDSPQPPIDGYQEYIDDAIKRNYLDADNSLQTIYKKKSVKNLHEALEEVDALANDRDLCSWYEEKYGDELNPSDQDFWDRHYDF